MNMNKYFKNFILFGDVESHCLLCKETFQSSSQVEKHIRWEKHRKSVKAQTYVPKFKKDLISKLDNHYYCEICNYSTQDIKTITTHINDDAHKINKANPGKVNKTSIGQHDTGFVVLQNTKINNSQWNGIIRKKCVVCSIDVSDIAKHVTSQDHIINLIQTDTLCEDGQYYRKINQNYFQCFTCKNTFLDNTFNEHWVSNTHLENMDKTKRKPNDEANNCSELEKLILETRDIFMETQKDFFDLNSVDETATCKTCQNIVHLDLKDMLMHMKKHHADLVMNKNTTDNEIKPARDMKTVYLYVDHGKRRTELALFGRENFIKLSEGARKAYCLLCDVCLAPEIKVFQDHIRGTYHSGHLKLKDAKDVKYENGKYKMITLNKFIKNLNYCTRMEAFLINSEYCVNNLSFIFIIKIDYNPRNVLMKCHACNIVFPPQENLNHCKTKQHAESVMTARVIDVKDEFIREIQPKRYHCGFCNQVFPFLETLEKHLKSWKHIFNKDQNKAVHSVEAFHQTYGWIPHIEQITLSSNTDMMHMQFIKYALNCTCLKI